MRTRSKSASEKKRGEQAVIEHKGEYEALAAFRYALRYFLRFSEEAAHSHGLTPQKHQAMLAVMGFPGRTRITIGELAERLQIRHHSAVGLVDRLEEQGLAVREHGTTDRRQVFVSLTEQGTALLKELAATHQDELSRLEPELARLLALVRSQSRPGTHS